MTHPSEPFRIVIDSREQIGHAYEFQGFETTRKKLDAGDYSVEGIENECAVERKTKTDAYGCVGAARDRFVRCLQRLGALRRSALVIECNLDEFISPPAQSHVHPSQAVGSFVSWCCQYRICGPIWVPDREYGERFTVKFLAAYIRHREALNVR